MQYPVHAGQRQDAGNRAVRADDYLQFTTLVGDALVRPEHGVEPGRVAELGPAHVHHDHRIVRIARQLCEVPDREPFLTPPKSSAGKRTVSIPSLTLADAVTARAQAELWPGSAVCGLTCR